jgi:hypothetical protein
MYKSVRAFAYAGLAKLDAFVLLECRLLLAALRDWLTVVRNESQLGSRGYFYNFY